jgi:hypothetical protein
VFCSYPQFHDTDSFLVVHRVKSRHTNAAFTPRALPVPSAPFAKTVKLAGIYFIQPPLPQVIMIPAATWFLCSSRPKYTNVDGLLVLRLSDYALTGVRSGSGLRRASISLKHSEFEFLNFTHRLQYERQLEFYHSAGLVLLFLFLLTHAPKPSIRVEARFLPTQSAFPSLRSQSVIPPLANTQK